MSINDMRTRIGLFVARSLRTLRSLYAGKEYCIKRGYESRLNNSHYDDRAGTDEWQREVYLYAADVMRRESLRTVTDVGCGAAYKLIHILGEYETVGVEVPPALDYLKSTYADREWLFWNDVRNGGIRSDLVLASDVIEHFPDPDDLISMIKSIDCKYILLSTPERDIVRGLDDYGPPKNPAHCREWNSSEFRAYIGRHFEILDFVITNQAQGTMAILCKPKASA